ncbi:MAG: putative transposase, partial [Mycobacterium sp.]|nr:putative transposase [Mycobacterium sp.]
MNPAAGTFATRNSRLTSVGYTRVITVYTEPARCGWRRPWRTIEEVELATAEWVHWFNHRRLYEYCGDIPPVELE